MHYGPFQIQNHRAFNWAEKHLQPAAEFVLACQCRGFETMTTSAPLGQFSIEAVDGTDAAVVMSRVPTLPRWAAAFTIGIRRHG